MSALGLTAHVFFGTLAFGATITSNLILFAIGRTRDARTAGATYESVRRIASIGDICFGLAILLGVAITLLERRNLTSPWLLTTYALIVLMIVINRLLVKPQVEQMVKAYARAFDVQPQEAKTLTSNTGPIAVIVFALIMFAILFLMIAKPDSI